MTLISMGVCPFCNGGHATPCFAEYDDGYCCFSCGRKKKANREFNLSSSAPTLDVHVIAHTRNPREFDLEILKWLYKYHVYDEVIRKHYIGYAPYEEFVTGRGVSFKGCSLILPVIVEHKIVMYQRRFFPNKQFITVGDKKVIQLVLPEEALFSDVCVLVEDYISSLRVGAFVDTICLHGTSLSQHVKQYLSTQNYTKIVLWLDGDKPGIEAADKIGKELGIYLSGYMKTRPFLMRKLPQITTIFSDKQPKEHTDEEIKNRLMRECYETTTSTH